MNGNCWLYLMNGSYDLAGLLIKGVRAPVRVEQMQLFDQSVVLSQKEGVQCDHSQMLIGPRVTCETFIVNNWCTQNCGKPTIHFLTSLKTGGGVLPVHGLV